MTDESKAVHHSVFVHGGDVTCKALLEFLSHGLSVLAIVKSVKSEKSSESELLMPFLRCRLLTLVETSSTPNQQSFYFDGNPTEQCLAALKAANAVPSCLTAVNVGQWGVEHAPTDDDIVVLAGAGTGKTSVMIDRVLFLLNTGAASPEQICMLTFTRNATRHMRDKLRDALLIRYRLTGQRRFWQWSLELPRMRIQTIPAFCFHLLKTCGEEQGYGPSTSIRSFIRDRQQFVEKATGDFLDQTGHSGGVMDFFGMTLPEFRGLVIEVWEELSRRGVTYEEFWSIDWGEVELPEQRTRINPVNIQAGLSYVIPRAADELHKLMHKEDSADLAWLTAAAQVSLLNAEAVRSSFGIRYLFIDEFQDTDDSQIKITAQLRACLDLRLFVVGDVKQSIYRFRGATYTAVDELRAELADRGIVLPVQPHLLRKNYRTREATLKHLDVVFEQMKTRRLLPYGLEHQLITTLPGGKDIVIETTVAKDIDARAAVLDLVNQAVASIDGQLNRLVALVRTNHQARLFKQWCEEDGLFCEVEAGGDLFAGQACSDLIALIKTLISPEDPVWMHRLLVSPYSSQHVHWGELLKFRGSSTDLSSYLNQYPPSENWNELLGKRRLTPALALLQQAVEEMNPAARFAAIELENLKEKYSDKNEEILQQEAQARALEYARELEATFNHIDDQFPGGFVGLHEISMWLQLQRATNREADRPSPREAAGNRIRCFTVHAAKGMEFDTVIIPFTSRDWRETYRNQILVIRDGVATNPQIGWRLADGDLSNSHFLDRCEEEGSEVSKDEARLLYVALTRTENRLFLLQHQSPSITNWAYLLRTG